MSVVSTKVKGSCLRWLTKNSTNHRNMCATLSLHAPRCTEDNLPTPHQAQPTNTHAARNQAGMTHALSKLLLSCPPHARSTSTVFKHGSCGKRASTRLERYTYGTDEGERTWPSHTTYDLQMPITLATADNSPLASQALRRLRVVCWMNNQSETRRSQRFCSSVAFVASVVFNF